MMLKILHINIEKRKHLDSVSKLIADKQPDIVCLEESILEDVENLSRQFNYQMVHSPIFNLVNDGPEGPAILSRIPISSKQIYFYGVNHGEMLSVTEESTMVKDGNRPKNRFSFCYSVPTIEIETKGKKTTIATTHFPVTDHTTPGLPDHTFDETEDVREVNHTRVYFDNLLSLIKHLPHPLIFTSDLNNPRGEHMFDALAHELVDLVPRKITSTIDPKLHKKKGLQLVVDTIMISQDLDVKGVEIIEGISDHKAILAEIEIK